MKKLVLVFVMLLTVSIASAKGPKFLGSWMSEKVIANGAVHQMFMPITFEDDNDMISEDMVFGIWRFNKKTKLINVTSFFAKEFNGDWSIEQLSKEKLVLKKGEFEWHLFAYDKSAITATNASLGLSGLWKLESKTIIQSSGAEENLEEAVEEAVEEEAVEEAVEEGGNQEESYQKEYQEPLPNLYLSFEDIDYSLKEISDGYSSSSKGQWMYKPKQNSILFIAGRRSAFIGEAKIIEHTDKNFSFENNGAKYVFEKKESVEIKPLTFDYEYLDNHRNDEVMLPWGEFDKLLTQMSSINTMMYSKGVFNSELGIFDNSAVNYETKVEDDYQVIITENTILDDGSIEENQMSIGEDYGSENIFFPLERLDDYIILGKETIGVPAGTFNCTVVIGIGEDDVKYKLWMIDDKPGVYAKIITQKEDYRGRMEYAETLLLILQ